MTEHLFGNSKLPPTFWAKVRINDATGCWEWTANRRPNGYARIRCETVEWHAHRFSYEKLVGPIPSGLQLDHLCRVRHCVNPAHLEPVTQLENMRRSGIFDLPATCKNGHEYTPENTYSNPRNGARVCRTCQRVAGNRYNQKRSGSPTLPQEEQRGTE